MSERKQRRTLKRLEDLATSGPVMLRFKDGHLVTDAYVYDVRDGLREGHELIYAKGGLPEGEGSKVDPADWLPNIPFHELGYLQVQSTGQKISFMPFQK